LAKVLKVVRDVAVVLAAREGVLVLVLVVVVERERWAD